jgi:hypothetical protein
VKLVFPAQVKLVALDDRTGLYNSTYSFVYGDTLLVGVEPTMPADNVLRVPSVDHAGVLKWVVRDSAFPTKLKFIAHTKGRDLELMPLNEVVEERYTVYFNLQPL